MNILSKNANPKVSLESTEANFCHTEVLYSSKDAHLTSFESFKRKKVGPSSFFCLKDVKIHISGKDKKTQDILKFL